MTKWHIRNSVDSQRRVAFYSVQNEYSRVLHKRWLEFNETREKSTEKHTSKLSNGYSFHMNLKKKTSTRRSWKWGESSYPFLFSTLCSLNKTSARTVTIATNIECFRLWSTLSMRSTIMRLIVIGQNVVLCAAFWCSNEINVFDSFINFWLCLTDLSWKLKWL